MLSGYRGFLRELARTGGWRALALQLRTGGRHAVRRLLGRGERDPIARFLANYGADGFGLPDLSRARLQLASEACLACGLCNVACAQAGGAPALEPRDAVVSAARLEIDWIRLRLDAPPPGPEPTGGSHAPACAACKACEPACPVGIPIAAVQETLARLSVATATRIR